MVDLTLFNTTKTQNLVASRGGTPALKRGEGDANAMGLGLIHDPHNPANTETGSPWLVGELPAELGMHMDMATGVSARSADKTNAAAFIQFAISPEMRGVWKAKGIARY